MTIADVIEHPDCPVDLADVLREASDELINAFSLNISETLRAVAALAKTRASQARAEVETLTTGLLSVKAATLNGASGK